MNIKYMFSLLMVFILFIIPYVGVGVLNMQMIFGIIIPYFAFIIFIFGIIHRIRNWAGSSVPFQIPTTCGQQKSLPWIEHSKIDCPTTKGGVFVRMILEIFCFRSLFRNSKMKLTDEGKISYTWEIWLWISALAFHYAFFVVIVRHLRLFLEPVPKCIQIIEILDGFLRVEFLNDFIHIGLPGIFISGVVLVAAALFLLIRRMIIPQVKYISLMQDYFPLFLILGIAISGLFMRYITKVNIVDIKAMTMGLVTLQPVIPNGIGVVFYIHLFLVCVLLLYFPFSKLMHMGGIFLSPTRNLTTNTREIRHINPWNYPVKIHSYEEYEEEFRDKMIEAGLPVEKE